MAQAEDIMASDEPNMYDVWTRLAWATDEVGTGKKSSWQDVQVHIY